MNSNVQTIGTIASSDRTMLTEQDVKAIKTCTTSGDIVRDAFFQNLTGEELPTRPRGVTPIEDLPNAIFRRGDILTQKGFNEEPSKNIMVISVNDTTYSICGDIRNVDYWGSYDEPVPIEILEANYRKMGHSGG